VVSFIPWPLYSWKNSPQYLFERRLGGPQRKVWTWWQTEKKKNP